MYFDSQMLSRLFHSIKSFFVKDELCGTWCSEDGSGFRMIMGSWMEIKPNGTGRYESWHNSKDDTSYSIKGEFNWNRIDQNRIHIQENDTVKSVEIKYKIIRKNGRIELTSNDPELEKLGIDSFWRFGQVMFKNKSNPMKKITNLLLLIFISGFSFAQNALELDWAELGKSKPWLATEEWAEVKKVTPGFLTSAPSDAIVLFDGTNTDAWHKPALGYGARMDQVQAILKEKKENPSFSPAEWEVKDGAMIVKPGGGAVETKQAFGSIQLHIEWLSPVDPGKKDQGYSNSGVFLMGLYEVQVLNSYENETYANGQAGAIYKQHKPMVNASRPPGEWQSYDIIFEAPEFNEDGSLKKAAYLTVFHNGVLIQNHSKLEGPCVYIDKSYYAPHAAKMPLLLQDHGDKVRFRNIWVREI